MTDYAELQVTSNFSFLRGASHPEELVLAAAMAGQRAVGIADRNSLAGVARAHQAAKQAGLRLAVGARLDFMDGTPSLLCYPTDRAAYGQLSRLLTDGKRRAPKGQCHLTRKDLWAWGDGQMLLAVPPDAPGADFLEAMRGLRKRFGKRLFLLGGMLYRGDDARRVARLADLAEAANTPLVAGNDVHAHAPDRRILQDVLTCIRAHVSLRQAGFRLHANAERHIKCPAEMARLFARYPRAVARTVEIAEACAFSLDELRYEYPIDAIPDGADAQEVLTSLTWEGAADRYPQGVPQKVRAQIRHELDLIAQLQYAPYFLTVHDLVRFARQRQILCQGRGSAANSAVCYCLGITAVDPDRVDVLFERFISSERNEPPDIDVDFEHERREEVIQYVYQRYGRERAGLTAAVISYRRKSAIREVGKVLGLSEDATNALSRLGFGYSVKDLTDDLVREAGLDPRDTAVRRTIALAMEMGGFPRHLSQHSGGMVMTRGRLDEMVPVENAAMEDRTVIEWDKDDLDALGILKVDVLALGMLTCVRKSMDLITVHHRRPLELATVPPEDPATYDMLCNGDSLGVFQVESRAQMAMLPRLKPRCFYDLVIEVAIVRPGPIQGDMVHPYLRRRAGLEAMDYPSRDLEAVLGKTLGVPLFQEQAMKIAIVAAGFTPSEADGLRRAMATFRKSGQIHGYRERMIDGMLARGYDAEFAERCFKQIEGFADYGFPESHAASFALLVYVSAWLKCHYPAAFACGLLNSQPMGFYAPAQIIRDARDHGVTVLPVDINLSDWDNGLESLDLPSGARRLRAENKKTSPEQGSAGQRASQASGGCARRLRAENKKTSPEQGPRGQRVSQGVGDPARRLRADNKKTSPEQGPRGQRVSQGVGDPARRLRADNKKTSPEQGPAGQAVSQGVGDPARRLRADNNPPPVALRLGFCQVKSLAEKDAEKLLTAREAGGPFASVADAWRRSGVGPAALEALARADGFGSLGLTRRDALWAVKRLGPAPLPLFAALEGAEQAHEPAVSLPRQGDGEQVADDYRSLRLSLKNHPMAFLRPRLEAEGHVPCNRLETVKHGGPARVAGLVIARQRPGTAKGVIFVTLEDETGIANLIVWQKVWESHRRAVVGSAALSVKGIVQREDKVVHLVVRGATDITGWLNMLEDDGGTPPGINPIRFKSRDFR